MGNAHIYQLSAREGHPRPGAISAVGREKRSAVGPLRLRERTLPGAVLAGGWLKSAHLAPRRVILYHSAI
jgi:hypothetical protein